MIFYLVRSTYGAMVNRNLSVWRFITLLQPMIKLYVRKIWEP